MRITDKYKDIDTKMQLRERDLKYENVIDDGSITYHENLQYEIEALRNTGKVKRIWEFTKEEIEEMEKLYGGDRKTRKR